VLRDPVTLACALVLIVLGGAAIFAPWLGLADPAVTSSANRLLPVGSPGHVLGADELGRDMLSRLIYGGRLSLAMGIVPVLNALVIGGTLGLVAGFLGGRTNMLIMRVTDVFYAFPSILLAVAIAGVLGAGVGNTLLAITIVFIPPITRVTESVTTQLRAMDFVEAARASGAGTFAIIRTHILGNVMGPVFVYATVLVSVSIVISAGLSFIGLGASPPDAEWGLMLNTLRNSIYLAPLVSILPGFMIFITSMCFNLISDGLRGAMDVRF
jgi:peptide/nickel transport system permease protein